MEIKQTDLKRRVERLYRLYLTHWDYVANHLSKISNPYLNKDNMCNCDLHFSYESSYGRAEIVLSKDLMIYDGVNGFANGANSTSQFINETKYPYATEDKKYDDNAYVGWMYGQLGASDYNSAMITNIIVFR